MLDVKIHKIADTVYGDDYEETDTYYIAEVNGTRWTQVLGTKWRGFIRDHTGNQGRISMSLWRASE